ncbi:MAG: GTP-binding DUF697 domain-containing protein [Synergistaceae bacterium]|jgi:uncharacterized protein (DUF697 family)/GTP-binding protein EngB required for normal cell division|nr:GTP-binding DUF697 domain-containing protein [Synergistaceae bacterium]
MKEYSQEAVNAEVKKIMASQKTPNILICGQTGIGKSSIVNFLFNDDVTTTGTGEPCTKGITLHKNPTVNIYDSEGYEIGSGNQQHYERMLFDDFLVEHHDASDPDAVHLVWYAISGASHRFTDLDVKLVQRIKKEGFKVCVLLSKIDELDAEQLGEMMSSLKEALSDVEIFRLSTRSRNNPALAKYCDWDELGKWSYGKLPAVFKERFVSALRGQLELKREQANTATVTAVAAAAAVGMSPIPLSDAALLVPIQTGMIVRIGVIYGIHVGKTAITSLAVDAVATVLGKSIADQILKCIPGIDTTLGGVINASVASALTGALGMAFSELCYKQCKDSLDGKPPSIDIEQLLTSASFIADVIKNAKEWGK